MMKKKLFVLLTVVCILALATACGSQTSGTDTDSNAGTQSGAQQKESTLTGKLDEVHIIYTRMVNAMKMEAEMEQLLPLKRLSFSVPANVPLEEINLKPSADAVINSIVPIYCSGFIYGSLVESYSCEQNSRMLAMQTATDSAKKMLSELSIAYNRARQAAITQEITEVISGARAQKNKK